MDHIRIHTKEKPFKCPFNGCEKKFAEKGNMRIHYKRHFKKNKMKNLSVCNSIEKETVDSIHDKDCFDNKNNSFNNNKNVNENEWNEMMKGIANYGDLNNFEFDKIDNDRGEKIDDLNFFMLLSSELNPMKLS